jgi:hypothetical protein
MFILSLSSVRFGQMARFLGWDIVNNVNKFLEIFLVKVGFCPTPFGKVFGMKMTNINQNEWWAALPAGEKDFIRTLMGMIKGAKRSEFRDVANAARKWESAISYFMKVRLRQGARRQNSGVRRQTSVVRKDSRETRESTGGDLAVGQSVLPATSCRSVLRSQQGVSASRD